MPPPLDMSASSAGHDTPLNTREAFIDHFCIVIKVHVIMKMGRRWSPDPETEANHCYDAMVMSNGRTTLTRHEFCVIVAPVLSGLFCQWERGHRFDHHVMTGVIYDALTKAGHVISRGPPSQGTTPISR